MAQRRSIGRSLLLTAVIGAFIGSAAGTWTQVLRGQIGGDGCMDPRGCFNGQNDKSSSSSSSKESESKGSSSSDKLPGENGGTTGGSGDLGGTTGGLGGLPPPPPKSGSSLTGASSSTMTEDERRRQEEAIRQVEEDHKRLEEEARERLRWEEELRQKMLEEARKNSQTTGLTDPQQGCFGADGMWTTDRSRCMQMGRPSQNVFEEGSSNAALEQVKEEELRKQMEMRYAFAAEMEEKRMVIVTLIGETMQRLIRLHDAKIVINAEQQQFIASSIEWLDGGQKYFAQGEHSKEEIEQMAGYIRQIVDYVQQIVDGARAAREEVGMLPDIAAIFTRTERLLSAFPDVLAILSREGVPADPNLFMDYGVVLSQFNEIKAECTVNAQVCGKLDAVLTGMQNLQASVLSAVSAAGKPEVEVLIREVVQSRANVQ